MTQNHTRVLIIGSGPAGYTAAIYAARASLQPIMIQGLQPGGQLMLTTMVENFPGFARGVDGFELMEQMKQQATHVGVQIDQDTIQHIDFSKRPFVCTSELGHMYTADTIVVATGAQARWLGLDSETKFRGFGVSSCATCDGFFFKDKVVAVVGGGNTAAEEAVHLTKHASKVYLIHRRGELRADKVMQSRVFDNPKIEPVWYHTVEEICGDSNPKAVTGIRIQHVESKAQQILDVEGVFIAIGHTPMTNLFKGHLDMDQEGYLMCPAGSTRTNIEGIFAAGDVQDKIYRQAITAAGQGCMAALDAERLLNHQSLPSARWD